MLGNATIVVGLGVSPSFYVRYWSGWDLLAYFGIVVALWLVVKFALTPDGEGGQDETIDT
jgi:hypothetical protein